MQTVHGQMVVTWTATTPEELITPTVREVVELAIANTLPWKQKAVLIMPRRKAMTEPEEPMFEVGYDFPPYDEIEANLRELDRAEAALRQAIEIMRDPS